MVLLILDIGFSYASARLSLFGYGKNADMNINGQKGVSMSRYVGEHALKLVVSASKNDYVALVSHCGWLLCACAESRFVYVVLEV